MKILGYKLSKVKPVEEKQIEASNYYDRYNDWYTSNIQPFDGEKTPYELGEPVTFINDYYALRSRAWEAYIKSDLIQNAIRKYILWIVGSGLKLQSNPISEVLIKNKVDINEKEISSFIEDSESQFRLFATMKESTFSKEYNLHDEAVEVFKNALLCGDILCILRYNGKYTSIETFDGVNIQTPILSDFIDAAAQRGNIINQGIEKDKKGSHVAYYLLQENNTYSRIPAYGDKSRKRQAWLFYGLKNKKSDDRGMSLLTAVLESASILDRYKGATLGGAEENANIPLTIEHNQFSDGSNPMIGSLAESFGKGKGVAPETIAANAETNARKIAESTNKTTLNLGEGQKLVRHSGSSDSGFAGFYQPNAEIIYATIGIPPEVALDKFGGAYSGSRAAIKSWEYKIMVEREMSLKRQFYKPFYDFWLDVMIMKNMIQAPGYLEALATKNSMVLEAYRNCRFIGATVPHIDPVKEVSAERLKLGKSLDTVPLTTIEQSCENLNTGDYDQMIKKVTNEKEIAGDFGDIANVPDNDIKPVQST